MCRSDPQIPTAFTFRMMSSGASTCGTARSSSSSVPWPLKITDLIVSVMPNLSSLDCGLLLCEIRFFIELDRQTVWITTVNPAISILARKPFDDVGVTEESDLSILGQPIDL